MGNHNGKMKILCLCYSLGAGGIEALCINILKNIDLSHYIMDFAVIKGKDEVQFYDGVVAKHGMQIHAVGDTVHGTLRKYITARRDIFRLIRNGNYDAVHIHSGHFDKVPDAISAKVCGVKKIIIHSHNGKLTRAVKLYHARCLIQKIMKQIMPFVGTDFCSCSDLASVWAFPKRLIENGRVIQVNNGIESEKFQYSDLQRKKAREMLGLSSNFVIGHIGRFAYQKNHAFLIDVFQKIVEKEPDARLLLIGTGALEEDVRNKVKKYGLEQNVIFYGITDEIPMLLSAMDVFVFPSLFEGLPVVGLEVQCMALRAVASDKISSNVKISEYWETMSLKQPPGAWADKVLEYCNGYERRPMKSVIEQAGFDIKQTVDLLCRIYAGDASFHIKGD